MGLILDKENSQDDIANVLIPHWREWDNDAKKGSVVGKFFVINYRIPSREELEKELKKG